MFNWIIPGVSGRAIFLRSELAMTALCCLSSAPAFADFRTLPAATTLSGSELLAGSQAAKDVTITLPQLTSYLGHLQPPAGAGNGTTDDTAAVVAASNATGVVFLPAGKTYRIASNASIGVVYGQGMLKVDSGITLTVASVAAPLDQIVFTGAGTIKLANNYISVGWFDGASLNEAWDFARRGMTTSVRKVQIFPKPSANDPRAQAAGVWKVTAPLYWGDPENNADIYSYAPFYGATLLMPSVIDMSTSAKTEDLYWRTGLSIDCGNKAIDGVVMHAVARFQVVGKADVGACMRDGISFLGDLTTGSGRGGDEIKLDFTSITNNGRYGINLVGTSSNGPYGADLGYVFTNGAKGVYATATVTSGGITSLSINANGPNGNAQVLYGFGYSGQVLGISSATAGNPGYGATCTPVIGGTNSDQISGCTITAAGSGFTNGETVFLTSADHYLNFAGVMRAVALRKFLEVQDSNANLTPTTRGLIRAAVTADGAPQGLDLNDVKSILGRRPALNVETADTSYTGRVRFSLKGARVPGPLYDGGALIRLAYVDEGYISDLTQSPSAAPLVSLGNATSNIRFVNVPREYVSGNGNLNTYDGEVALYSANGLASGSSISSSYTFPAVTTRMSMVSLVSPTAGATYLGYLVGNKLVDVSKGSLVDTSTLALTGSTGTSGRVTLSVNGGKLYLENRTAAAMPYEVVIGR